MNIVKLDSAPNMQNALEIVDSLRSDVESGRVVAFAVVAIEPDDEVMAYTSSVRPVSVVRIMGAISHLLHKLHSEAGG
jgi:predicted nucleotide-binding protein